MKLERSKNIARSSFRIWQLKEKYPRYFLGLVLAIGTAILSIALSVYAYLGTFSRYYADDYCLSSTLSARDLLKTIIITYQTWSNKYAATFLMGFSELFGRSVIRFWTLLLLVLWVPALAWALLQASRLMRLNFSKWMAVILAEALIFFTMIESPNLFQTFFWRMTMIMYTLPLVFLALLAGLILNGIVKTRDGTLTRPGLILGLIGCAGLAFFAGGLSETYITLQTGILGLAFLLALLLARGKIRRTWLLWLGVSLIGTVIALVIVILSPGNAIRQASLPHPPGILKLMYSTAANALSFMYISLHDYSFQTVLVFLLAMLLAYVFVTSRTAPARPRPAGLVWALLLAPLVSYLSIAAICAPSAYAQSSYPEPHVLIEARFVMVLLLAVEGLIIGVGLGQVHVLSNEPPPFLLRILVTLVAIAMLFYPLYDARKAYAQVPDYRARATAWDARDAQIRAEKAQGLENIQVDEFTSLSGVSELQPDAGFWVNSCAAGFYGVKTIKAIEAP